MKLGPFRAVLAHEYGHFSNRDTAGGGLALAVRRSLLTMAAALAEGGVAHWYNPAWLFLNAFYRVFLRISQGASRLQEVLADRWAALAYGSQAFQDGLRHVIERAIRFNAHANATLQEVVGGAKPLVNLYTFQPATHGDETEIARAVERAFQAEPSPYDSHPSPQQRCAWVQSLGVATEPGEEGDPEVWALFSDRSEIEQWMTRRIQDNLRSQGVSFAA